VRGSRRARGSSVCCWEAPPERGWTRASMEGGGGGWAGGGSELPGAAGFRTGGGASLGGAWGEGFGARGGAERRAAGVRRAASNSGGSIGGRPVGGWGGRLAGFLVRRRGAGGNPAPAGVGGNGLYTPGRVPMMPHPLDDPTPEGGEAK